MNTNMNTNVNNGRIDVMGKTNLDVFTLYDQIPISETTSDFREALTGTTTSTMLSTASIRISSLLLFVGCGTLQFEYGCVHEYEMLHLSSILPCLNV